MFCNEFYTKNNFDVSLSKHMSPKPMCLFCRVNVNFTYRLTSIEYRDETIFETVHYIMDNLNIITVWAKKVVNKLINQFQIHP